MRNLAPLVAILAAIFLLAGGAVSQDAPGDVLRLLREKALERESAFDNIEVKYRWYRPGPDGKPQADPAQVRWVKSGDLVYYEADLPHNNQILTRATNGETAYWHKRPKVGDVSIENPGVVIYKADPDAQPEYVTPENFAVVRMPCMPWNESSSEAVSSRLARMADAPGVTVTRETVDGRSCLVVSSGTKESGFERLCFDEARNCACIRIDSNRGSDGRAVYVMGDFRELKPGLFVPFEASMEEHSGTGSWGQKPPAGGVTQRVEFRVDSAESLAVTDEALFRVPRFPAGTRVYDNVARISYIAGTPQDEAIVTSQLPQTSAERAPGSDAGQQPSRAPAGTTPAPTEAPQSKPAGPRIPAAVWILAAILAAIAAAVTLRSLRKKPPTDVK